MKFLFVIIGALFCCHLATVNAIGNLDGYRKVSSKEFAGLDHIIQSGTTAALDLAVADNVIDADAAARFQIKAIGHVARQVRAAENVTSYFIIVRGDVKTIVGFVIDEDSASGGLTLRAYKIGSA